MSDSKPESKGNKHRDYVGDVVVRKLQTSNRIAMPKKFVDALDFSEGDQVAVKCLEDGVKITGLSLEDV